MKQKSLLTDRILQSDLANPDAAHRFFAVTVKDGWQPARAAEPLIVPFTKGLALFDFKCFGHGNATRER